MSFHHVSWVLKRSEAKGSARMILMVLAHHANDEHEAYPSIGTLVEETRLGRSTIIETLRKMHEDGTVLRVGPHPSPRYKGATVYRLADPWGSESRTGPDSGPVQTTLSEGSRPRTQKTKGNDQAEGDRARDPRDEVPDDFPDELRPHARAVLPILRDVAAQHGAPGPRVRSVARAMMARPRKPLVRAAHDFASWAADPPRPIRDVVSSYRTWLDRERDLAAVERLPGGDVGANGTVRAFKRTAPVEMQTDPKGEHGRQRA